MRKVNSALRQQLSELKEQVQKEKHINATVHNQKVKGHINCLCAVLDVSVFSIVG